MASAAQIFEDYAKAAPTTQAKAPRGAAEVFEAYAQSKDVPQAAPPDDEEQRRQQFMQDNPQPSGMWDMNPSGNPDAGKFLMGVPETLLSGVTGAAGTLADVATLSDPGTHDWAYSPRTAPGQFTAEKIREAASPVVGGISRGYDKAFGTGPLAQTVKERGIEAANAITTVVGAGGALKGGVSLLERPSTLVKEAGRAAEAPDMTVQLGKSGGAAAAATDLSTVSPELRQKIQEASRSGNLNHEAAQRHIEAESLPVRMRLTEGQATQDPVAISREQNARGKNPELASVFNEQNRQLIENLDEIRMRESPTVVHQDHVQNGQSLLDSYKAADEPVRADIAEKYKALEEANGGQFPLNGKDFVTAADAALAKKMKGRFVPAGVSGDLAELRDGGPMTFETFENLRTNLAAEARKAERSGDGNAAAAVNIVRESLESLPMTGEAAKIKPLADAARSAAKARFDKLREDPAYRAAVEDSAPAGEHSPLADNFVEKYIIKGKAAHIKKMRETLQSDPTANETISASVLNYLKSKSGINLYTNEGNFSQAGFNKALSEVMPKIGDLLDEPTIEQVQALGNVARYTQAQPRGAFVNNSNTFTSAAAAHGANVLEGVVNFHAGGIPVGTAVRKKLQGRSERRFVESATQPGAGVADGSK